MDIINDVRIFCSDLDGTLLGEPDSTADFATKWNGLDGKKPLLIYSTGRLVEDAQRVVRENGLPQPNYCIAGVGTMIHEVAPGRMMREFSAVLDENWNLQQVVEMVSKLEGIEPQPAEQQHAWKSSWYWRERSGDEIRTLGKALAVAGAQVVYSSSRDLDILPERANKGNALAWLCGQLGVSPEESVVAGDTGNDASMFLLPGIRGIVVGNAEPELSGALNAADVYRAKGLCAAGVLEGLRHYGVIGN